MSGPGWQELRFDTRHDDVAALEDWLFEQGAVAVTLEDNADEPLLEPGPGETPLWQQVKVIALFNEGQDLKPVADGVPPALVKAGSVALSHVPDQDWERAWMDSFHPMQMGDRLWICPSWTPPPEPQAVNILLDPGLAFGTGTHPTTAMCLGALDQLTKPGMTVVDYGCGTGILAIAALKLGAERALGIDNDPQAIVATRQNAERNDVAESDLVAVMPESYAVDGWAGSADIVVANILAGPLVSLSTTLADFLKPGGSLLLAGLLEEQAEELIAAYSPWIDLSAARELEGWVLLSGRRD